jgi:hypothetical protein
MVESVILLRSDGDGTDESPFGPRQADLAPYTSLAWEDVTGRAGDAIAQFSEPRVVIIRGRMSNADALAMSTDNKLWAIESRRYSTDEDGNVVEVDNNKDDAYTAEERTTRITQLGKFTDFEADKIAAWWTPDKTRREVAVKLRDYLRTLAVE